MLEFGFEPVSCSLYSLELSLPHNLWVEEGIELQFWVE
jgi:hypothetical protein